MKIAFLIDSLDVRGGTHKQFLKLLDYTENQGEDFFIVTRRFDPDRTYLGFRRYADRVRILTEEPEGSHSIFARMYRRYRMCRKLARLVKDADVVNVHDSGFETLLPAFRGKRTVWQINDLYYGFRVGVNSDIPDSRYLRRMRGMILRGLRYVDEIVVNVTKNAERVASNLNRHATVLYCGIEPVGLTHNSEDSFSRFRNRRINLLSSGVWLPYRNYESQVEVVRRLVEKGYDVNLSIIGTTEFDPGYVAKIRKMIADNSLSDRIEICGMVDEKRFRELHEQADVFLFVNVDQSWGLAVFEAMSCGLPVIVSRSVGATEILHDGVDSIFVNSVSPGEIVDKIEKLVTDRNHYLEISAKASQFHTAYTWESAYSSPMLEILREGSPKK